MSAELDLNVNISTLNKTIANMEHIKSALIVATESPDYYYGDHTDKEIKKLMELVRDIHSSAFKVLRVCESTSSILQSKIEEMCEHNFVTDGTVFDPCRTIYFCTKCNKSSN